jgi:glutathione S-transferase
VHKGGLRDPAYLALNPVGQVPTLIIDGQPMVEKPAILMTARALSGGRNFAPPATFGSEGRGLSRACFGSGGLTPIVTRIMFPNRFCDASETAAERSRELARAMMLANLASV